MTLKIRVALIVWVGALVLMASDSASAWVRNISLERAFVGENIRLHEVQVRCRIEKKTRALRKIVSSNSSWCSVDVPSLCSRSKVAAARKMGKLNASEFRELAVSAQSQSVAGEVSAIQVVDEPEIDDADSLKEEQLLIEEQRIEIEQRRIELTRREVGLKKELNEISSVK